MNRRKTKATSSDNGNHIINICNMIYDIDKHINDDSNYNDNTDAILNFNPHRFKKALVVVA